jgi:hypothetical protein
MPSEASAQVCAAFMPVLAAHLHGLVSLDAEATARVCFAVFAHDPLAAIPLLSGAGLPASSDVCPAPADASLLPYAVTLFAPNLSPLQDAFDLSSSLAAQLPLPDALADLVAAIPSALPPLSEPAGPFDPSPAHGLAHLSRVLLSSPDQRYRAIVVPFLESCSDLLPLDVAYAAAVATRHTAAQVQLLDAAGEWDAAVDLLKQDLSRFISEASKACALAGADPENTPDSLLPFVLRAGDALARYVAFLRAHAPSVSARCRRRAETDIAEAGANAADAPIGADPLQWQKLLQLTAAVKFRLPSSRFGNLAAHPFVDVASPLGPPPATPPAPAAVATAPAAVATAGTVSVASGLLVAMEDHFGGADATAVAAPVSNTSAASVPTAAPEPAVASGVTLTEVVLHGMHSCLLPDEAARTVLEAHAVLPWPQLRAILQTLLAQLRFSATMHEVLAQSVQEDRWGLYAALLRGLRAGLLASHLTCAVCGGLLVQPAPSSTLDTAVALLSPPSARAPTSIWVRRHEQAAALDLLVRDARVFQRCGHAYHAACLPESAASAFRRQQAAKRGVLPDGVERASFCPKCN